MQGRVGGRIAVVRRREDRVRDCDVMADIVGDVPKSDRLSVHDDQSGGGPNVDA
jgi:hypothetical protein